MRPCYQVATKVVGTTLLESVRTSIHQIMYHRRVSSARLLTQPAELFLECPYDCAQTTPRNRLHTKSATELYKYVTCMFLVDRRRNGQWSMVKIFPRENRMVGNQRRTPWCNNERKVL